MVGLGTIINVAAIILGGAIGLLIVAVAWALLGIG